MSLIHELSSEQIAELIDTRAKYIKYLEKHGEIRAVRARVNEIDLLLKNLENPNKMPRRI